MSLEIIVRYIKDYNFALSRNVRYTFDL